MNQGIPAMRHGIEKTAGLRTNPNVLFQELRTRHSMSCDVVFGSPSADCRGTGVCKITARNPQAPVSAGQRDCRSTMGIFIRGDGGKGVAMLLMKGLLCPNILRRHLLSGILELKEPCFLPPSLVSGLSLSSRVLAPGKYRIEELSLHYLIHFK